MHRLLRWINASTLAALAAPVAFAQAPPAGDLLDQTRRLQQVALDRLFGGGQLSLLSWFPP